MKTKINKSEIMKKAWEMYKRVNFWNDRVKKFAWKIKSFSACLKQIWANVKFRVWRENHPPVPVSFEIMQACADGYRTRKYNGD